MSFVGGEEVEVTSDKKKVCSGVVLSVSLNGHDGHSSVIGICLS